MGGAGGQAQREQQRKSRDKERHTQKISNGGHEGNVEIKGGQYLLTTQKTIKSGGRKN